eukprot:CAMPEP_0170608622 /NCGR_PEP_ID=MMETSP0224-20130122/21685_1 /TAXON_ID=285029 /ORGANISM="Togula jolla, Strain CCCM 725" /LENGTH=100 /DNA_ID=CAMNT_0010933865 /DNA_START=115 /DNA_END=417 /DNA_ORIENTATION=-
MSSPGKKVLPSLSEQTKTVTMCIDAFVTEKLEDLPFPLRFPLCAFADAAQRVAENVLPQDAVDVLRPERRTDSVEAGATSSVCKTCPAKPICLRRDLLKA